MSGTMYAEPEEARNTSAHNQRAEVANAVIEIDDELSTIPERVFTHLVHKVSSATTIIVKQIRNTILGATDEGTLEALRSLGIPTADIEHDCEQLRSQVEADRYSGRLVCQSIGQGPFVPISDAELMANERYYHQQSEHDVRLLSTEEAVDNFCNELNPFLAHRVAGRGYFPLAQSIVGGPSQMLPIKVFSPTSGARVSYSPAYFINYITLAAPTSPVLGSILPGRYIFMISTAYGKKFDQGVFDIPPSFNINLLV